MVEGSKHDTLIQDPFCLLPLGSPQDNLTDLDDGVTGRQTRGKLVHHSGPGHHACMRSDIARAFDSPWGAVVRWDLGPVQTPAVWAVTSARPPAVGGRGGANPALIKGLGMPTANVGLLRHDGRTTEF